jgi:hypothetical protein
MRGTTQQQKKQKGHSAGRNPANSTDYCASNGQETNNTIMKLVTKYQN